jgi:DNA invertase Pin-like site-specific DNA recombinase
LKSLRTYAKKSGFDVVREFIDIESAKSTGRKPFGEMIDYLKPRLSGKS